MPFSGRQSKELCHTQDHPHAVWKRYNMLFSISGHRNQLMDFNKEIDTRGLNCPLPILRAKKALAELESGQVLKVVATDPGSTRDFAAFSKQTGHGLLESSEANREFFFYLKKK